MVLFRKQSALQETTVLNFRVTMIVVSCVIIVSCESKRHQDEEIALNSHHQFPPMKNELTGVLRDNKEITEVKDLEKIVLDEQTLQNFPIQRDGHIKWIDIAKSISHSHIKKFGVLLLGLERTLQVNAIVEQNPELACEMILLKWLEMEGAKNEPITFRTLVTAIYKLGEYFENGYSKLAQEIANTAEIHQTIDIDYIPALAKKYSSKLLERYQKDPVINSSQWIPKMLLDRNITFVDLEIKEKNNNNLTLENLLHDIQDGMRVLFTGKPGVGKSTITRYLSKYIHLKQFFLIIKLHLGVLNEPIGDLDTLLKVHGSKSFSSDDIAFISNFIRRTSGRGVCFLLDGYDEYSPSRHGSYINSLVKDDKHELTKSVVIVTSRPSAAEDIKNLFQRKIEIVGFGESGMNTYLRQLKLPDETITQYLDNHPNVRQMCYLPLHLSMLVYIGITTHNNLTLLDTETELYNNFLSLTIKQYEDVRHKRDVESLKECFSNTNTQTDLCNILRNISKLAFDGLNNRTQMFTSLSLTGLLITNLSAKIEALSLFKIETSYDRSGSRFFKYWYSHPTFQEFLAAFYLTTLSKDMQLNYISYWWMHEVYKYFFGLIRSMSLYDDQTRMNMFISFAKEDMSTYPNRGFYIMKCAHEAAPHVSQYIPYLQAAGLIGQNNSLYAEADYSYNCWYLGYILAQTPLHELTVSQFSGIALCLSFISKYLKNDARTSAFVNVTKLIIGEHSFRQWPWFTNEEDSVDIVDVMEFLSVFQGRPTHLELKYFKFGQINSVLNLGKILKSFNMLQSIVLSVNVSIIEEGHLEKALQDLTHLRHLGLGIINRHDDDTAIPDSLLEFRNLKQLESLTLYISWNKTIVDVNMTALLGGLKCLDKLETLSMHLNLYAGFRNHGADELLLGIQELRSIKNLTLDLDLCWEGGVGNVSIRELAKVLSSLRMLINLSLCITFKYSGVGHIGVIELANGLRNLTELQDLRLDFYWEMDSNDTIDGAAIVLADRLKHLHKLQTLNLDLRHNGSYNKIMELLPSLIHLKNLKLKWTRPGETDVRKLLSELKSLTQLQKLDLSSNTIRDEELEPLIEALKEMNNLHTLDLSGNEIGDNGIKLVSELFDYPELYMRNLQVLILSYNEFSEVGAKILAEKLKKLPQLHTLEFNLKLGAYSAEVLSLIQHQKLNKTAAALPEETSLFSIIKSFFPVFQVSHLYYYMFSVILGLVGVVYLCIKSKANKMILSGEKISRALCQSSFSVSAAWDIQRLDSLLLDGTGTTIAILDTAIDPSYPSFTGKEILVINCLPHILVTSNVHGTICSAVAVGSQCVTPLGVIPRGVAPGAGLIVYRVAEGDCWYNVAILEALDDIYNKVKGGMQIDVVSMSCDCGENGRQEICSKIEILTEIGITFVAAAGNRGYYQPRASFPASLDSVISVGALDRNGKISTFTAKGRVDVYAPGEDIEFPSDVPGINVKFMGTSYANPAVGSIVLLLKQWANYCMLDHQQKKIFIV